jgi:hypothetical protein
MKAEARHATQVSAMRADQSMVLKSKVSECAKG